nr:MAG TPA: hypothetical protein [Caudoviricetes sp.]
MGPDSFTYIRDIIMTRELKPTLLVFISFRPNERTGVKGTYHERSPVVP